MRVQLIQYVELLFAGAPDCEEIKQEILQNTLDRYDDLIAEGRVPEAAYRLAISGIGDINEILGTAPQPLPQSRHAEPVQTTDTPVKKLLRAAAIGLYILAALPLILLSEMDMETLGLCCTLAIVAVATVLVILGGKKEGREERESPAKADNPRQELKNSIGSVIWAIGLALYFLLSFMTHAWYITWILFPLIGAVQGLVNAIMDLKEANSHEI